MVHYYYYLKSISICYPLTFFIHWFFYSVILNLIKKDVVISYQILEIFQKLTYFKPWNSNTCYFKLKCYFLYEFNRKFVQQYFNTILFSSLFKSFKKQTYVLHKRIPFSYYPNPKWIVSTLRLHLNLHLPAVSIIRFLKLETRLDFSLGRFMLLLW